LEPKEKHCNVILFNFKANLCQRNHILKVRSFKRRFHGGFTSVARSGLAWLWKSGFQFSFSWWLATSRQPHLRACAIGRASVELFDHIYLLRGCLIPCLPRVPKKATQCVPECCILRRRMYSVIIFIFTHVTKLHFSVFTKTREKTREKQKKNMNL
jgi:hypothetical protein